MIYVLGVSVLVLLALTGLLIYLDRPRVTQIKLSKREPNDYLGLPVLTKQEGAELVWQRIVEQSRARQAALPQPNTEVDGGRPTPIHGGDQMSRQKFIVIAHTPAGDALTMTFETGEDFGTFARWFETAIPGGSIEVDIVEEIE